jgi:hypothetical protein
MDLFILFSESQSLSTKGFFDNDIQKRKPNVKLTIFNEGFFWGSTNDDGFIGDNFNNEIENNIILIGDSYVEGFQLFQRHHFMTHIKKSLNKRFGVEYTIINRGMGEKNLSDSYISFHNSLTDSSMFLIFINPDQLHMKSYVTLKKPFVYIENEHLKVDTRYKSERTYRIYEKINSVFSYSTIFQSIKLMINKIVLGQHIEILFGKLNTLIHVESNNNVIQEDNKKNISEVNKRILLDLSSQKDIFLVLMKNITKSQKNWLDQNNIKTISLEIPLSELKNSGLNPYYWNVTKMEGHWNHRAHKEIGKYIANKIAKRI